MNSSLTDIVQLRNNINFASISQFFHTFQSAFRPWPVTTHDIIYARNLETNEYVFETEDLERMILDPSERIRFEDLLVRMLRLVSGKRFINASTWQTHFAKEFEKRQLEEVNPFHTTVQVETNETTEATQEPIIEAVNYFTLSLDTRIYLLYLLCEWQLDEPEKFREHLDGEEDAVQWRVDPIGFDKKGNTFWLFDDNRLYKETPKPKPSKKKKPIKKKRAPPPPPPSGRRSSRRNQPATEEEPEIEEQESEDEGEWMPWKLLCCTKYEWEQFPLKYAHSKHVDEQRFYTLLVNDLLPKIIPVMEEHEREIKKQEAIMHRKRSSRIMIKELEALERSSSHEPEIEQVHLSAGRGRASNRIEKKTLEKEQKELELAAKAREERLLERERRIAEREYRALAREKRQESEDPVALVQELTQSEQVAPPILSIKMTVKENKDDKPKRKYVKKDKFDKDGNPIPRKVKLDKDGNPIPLKKRGRKPKNKNLDEENWVFDCICGVSGKNLDDGTPMIACEKCGVWQHIKCLQKSGQIEKRKNMDDVAFVCRPCENQEVDIDGDADEPQSKRIKVDNVQPMDYQHQLPKQPLLTPQNLMQIPQQQPIVSWQQPSAVRGPYYPPTTSVLPPIRTPSLSSIHNLINNITAPPRTPSSPSSTIVEPPTTPSFPVGGLSTPTSNLEAVSSPSSVIVEPPTPPIAHQKAASTQSQQAPTSKLSEPIHNHKHVQVAPTPQQPALISQQPVGIAHPIAQQAPLPVLIDSQQLSPFIQQGAQAPVSTVRGPIQVQIANPPVLPQIQPVVHQPPTVTAPPTEAVQVTANTPAVPLPPQSNL